jgi:uncharacterized membrane protein (DUF2068 family)
MATQTTQRSATRQSHDRWLVLIGGFKILEGLLFVLIGFGVIRLLHRDIADVLLRTVMAVRLDPESRFVNFLLDKVQLLTPHKMRLISFGIFIKAGIDFAEGIGLAMEKTWAEWLTIGLTASFLPWEIFEILRHFTWIKVALAVINVLVLLYLLWIQQKRLRALHSHTAHAATAPKSNA